MCVWAHCGPMGNKINCVDKKLNEAIRQRHICNQIKGALYRQTYHSFYLKFTWPMTSSQSDGIDLGFTTETTP